MQLQAEIKRIEDKKLIGKRIRMNLANDKTFELWRSFMPRRKEISNNLNTELISMKVFPPSYDLQNPESNFEKWAAVEVSDFDIIPEGMESYTLVGGLYAVFHFKGNPNNASGFFLNIFKAWMPASGFVLDNRPHFEILGDKFNKDAADSEEDIYIPIR